MFHNGRMLVIFSGLPGVGKTAMARELARQIGGVHLRIDSIEQAVRGSSAWNQRVDDVGYRVAHAVAEDNLRIGRTVIADSVNPLRLTRDAWVNVAKRADRSHVLGARGTSAESRTESTGYSRLEDANMGRRGRKGIPRLGPRTSGDRQCEPTDRRECSPDSRCALLSVIGTRDTE
jgi:DNA polymerase III delta prime subunit